MTPARFRECLRQIRWTSIDIVNSLQCDLAWIEAIEAGEIVAPENVAVWLEGLATYHLENPPPDTSRARTVFEKTFVASQSRRDKGAVAPRVD